MSKWPASSSAARARTPWQHLTDIPGIREFQVRQSDRGATILVCGDLTADRASGLVARLGTELGDHGLVEPKIDVRLVDRIEPTPGR